MTLLPDDLSRYRAPERMHPQCSVAACDRDAYTETKGWTSPLGKIEMPSFRLCAEHEARWYLVTLLFLGDAHATKKWKAYIEALALDVGVGNGGVLGVGPGTLPAVVVSEATEWRCARCGGGMVGSRSHNSWTHRCELPSDKRKNGVG